MVEPVLASRPRMLSPWELTHLREQPGVIERLASAASRVRAGEYYGDSLLFPLYPLTVYWDPEEAILLIDDFSLFGVYMASMHEEDYEKIGVLPAVLLAQVLSWTAPGLVIEFTGKTYPWLSRLATECGPGPEAFEIGTRKGPSRATTITAEGLYRLLGCVEAEGLL